MAFPSTLLPRSSRHHPLVRQAQRFIASTPCVICADAARQGRSRPRSNYRARPRRYLSTTANARVELENTLLELQKHAPNFVNLSRLQLALQGLRQGAGNEVIRVAILGLENGPTASSTARRILRVLLADPLQEEQSWEKQLGERSDSKPLILRVGPPQKHAVSSRIERETGLDEMYISSPQFNEYNLEFLLMEVVLPDGASGETSVQGLEDAVLVPAVDIPAARDRASLMATPVHRALLIADGLSGAVKLSALPIAEAYDSIAAVAQIEGVSKQQLGAQFDVVDISLAEQGVRLFRQGPQYAMDYERLWFASNVSHLTEWLKAGAANHGDGTRPAVRKLIASVLHNTLSQVQLQEARKLSKSLKRRDGDPAFAEVQLQVANWAQQAHSELRDELDLAFQGRRWRKLGWWKLFWRVDDVVMLTTEMLSRRFLPTAEQELVYLAGRISQLSGSSPEYPQPKSSQIPAAEPAVSESGHRAPTTTVTSPSALPKWPGHIAFTRRYLQNETVPALQSLAQRLVLESLGTSGLASSLAALLYVSSLSSTVYEAGAVAALGIVYGLGRMQKKWDAARTFWEGEVYEEGRKAVRAAEESVAAILDSDSSLDIAEEGGLERTKELLAHAEDALSLLK